MEWIADIRLQRPSSIQPHDKPVCNGHRNPANVNASFKMFWYVSAYMVLWDIESCVDSAHPNLHFSGCLNNSKPSLQKQGIGYVWCRYACLNPTRVSRIMNVCIIFVFLIWIYWTIYSQPHPFNSRHGHQYLQYMSRICTTVAFCCVLLWLATEHLPVYFAITRLTLGKNNTTK